MIEPISSRSRKLPSRQSPPKAKPFRGEMDDLRGKAREKASELKFEPGKYQLSDGNELQLDVKKDGKVELDVRAQDSSQATIDFSKNNQEDPRLAALNESDEERERSEKGPKYTDLGRGELVDTRM